MGKWFCSISILFSQSTENLIFRQNIDGDNIRVIGRGNLQISHVKSTMAGNYKCVANNQNGQVQAVTKLQIQSM